MPRKTHRERPKPPPANAVTNSGNRKTGPVHVTHAAQVTCPATCPHRRNGCYAETGMVTWTTRRLNEAAMIHDLGGVNILVRRPGVEWNGQPMEALAEVAGRAFDDGRPVVYGDERLLDAAADEVLGKWQHHAGRVVFDHVVDNDGDVAKLKKVAQMFIGSRLTNPEEAT